MSNIVQKYRKNPVIRDKAESLTHNVKQKDFAGETQKIFDFVQNEIRYVRDPRGMEMIQYPDRTLEIGSGDCDDKTVLLATLLESIGIPTALQAVGFSPNRFTHVFVLANLQGKWIGLETTEPWKMGSYVAKPLIQMRVIN